MSESSYSIVYQSSAPFAVNSAQLFSSTRQYKNIKYIYILNSDLTIHTTPQMRTHTHTYAMASVVTH